MTTKIINLFFFIFTSLLIHNYYKIHSYHKIHSYYKIDMALQANRL